MPYAIEVPFYEEFLSITATLPNSRYQLDTNTQHVVSIDLQE